MKRNPEYILLTAFIVISAAAVIVTSAVFSMRESEENGYYLVTRLYDDSGYMPVRSENYWLRPTDSEYGYRIVKKNGESLIGIMDYGDPFVIEDEETGKTFLLLRYVDGNSYTVNELDDELKCDIIEAMGKNAWYVYKPSELDVTRDENTGLYYIREKGRDVWMSHILLRDEADIAAYDALADKYADMFSAIIPDRDVGYIYAAMEVEGISVRFDEGWLFIATGGMQFVDVKDAGTSWTLNLTREEYIVLTEYMRENYEALRQDKVFGYDEWKIIFDRLGVEHDMPLNPESPRYQAAMEELVAVWGEYPYPGMTTEQAERNLRNRMKEYDDEGYRISIYGIAGMYGDDIDVSERHMIIDIPEEYRQAVFDYEYRDLAVNNGVNHNFSEIENLYQDFQSAMSKDDRLKATWTLGRYRMIYCEALMDAIYKKDPDWEPGDAVDDEVFSGITRETVESRIVSDGEWLYLTWGDDVSDAIFDKEADRQRRLME